MSEWEFRLRFSRWLKHQRVTAKLSQIALAGRLNCRVLELANWETGNSLPNVYYYHLIIGLYGDFMETLKGDYSS